MKIILPKNYLSFSQYALWNSSKGSYRKRYYLNQKPPTTKQMEFGKKIARILEDKNNNLDFVPQYPVPEEKIEVEIKGVKLLGFIDTFDPEECKYREFKTGHANKAGKAPWDKIKVQKHVQLPFYSVLIEEKYSKVCNITHLDWIETEKVSIPEEINGISYETGFNDKIELTGKMETFERTITKAERNRMRQRILKTAIEISDDYQKYIKENI